MVKHYFDGKPRYIPFRPKMSMTVSTSRSFFDNVYKTTYVIRLIKYGTSDQRKQLAFDLKQKRKHRVFNKKFNELIND